MVKFNCKVTWVVIVVLLCTLFIFSNSLKNSEKSHSDSGFFVKIVKSVADAIFPNNECDWNFIVRKGAHLFEFFVLGVFTALLSLLTMKRSWPALLAALLYLCCIASIDEFIQRFTGRTSSFSDVIIDLVGGCVGVTTVLLLRLALDRKRARAACRN